MTQCWPEGALRAYLDRELAPEDIQRAAAHLRECTNCEALCGELAARAARVAMLVDLLPELEAETLHIPVRMPRRASGRPRVGWVTAAVALAAGLGLVAYLVPQRQTTPVEVVTVTPPAKVAVKTADATTGVTMGTSVGTTERAEAAEEPAVAVRPAKSSVRRAGRAVPEAGDFVALDDEPFESGVIMRVGVTPGNTQADIVFGPDGRARAFRLVKQSF